MAQVYCLWRNAKLPSEAQWEKTARGENGLLFPWGNERNSCEKTGTCPNDLFVFDQFSSDVSPYGVFNLNGNALEWVADWFDFYKKAYTDTLRNPLGPDLGSSRVVKGGTISSYFYGREASRRVYHEPQLGFMDVGFRCAKDANP